MFGRRFAYQYGGADQGWTPPWLHDEREWHGHEHGHHGHHGHHGRGPEFGPRFFMHRMRGPFGFGPGPFGPGGREGSRAFGRGDLKYALLELLQERPMHGYEMMKALEEKSGGFYSPSPGSVYPTLQMLEDGGYVTSKETDGKKVYSITDAGRALLTERSTNQEQPFGPPWMRGFGRGRRPSPEMQALRSEAMEVMRLFAIAGRMAFQDPEQLSRLRSIIEHTRKDLTDMIYGSAASKGEGTAQQTTPTAGEATDGPTVEQA
jgi:DNA-binding PadR family transcriptional regulator